jgi:hypothetical protein
MPEQNIGTLAQVVTSSEPDDQRAVALQIKDRVRELRRVAARELLPQPKNWRRHPKVQVDALRGLLVEVGYADALPARELPDGRLMLVDGHLRAETTPDAEVPVLVLDLSAEEAEKVLVTLDPLAALAESDSDRIKALLQTVRTDNPAIADLIRRTAGDKLWELIHPLDLQQAEISPDRVAQLKKKWATQPGQLWQIGSHRIISGDSTDESVVSRLWQDNGVRLRLIWTDPPYVVEYASKNAYLNQTDRGNPAAHRKRPSCGRRRTISRRTGVGPRSGARRSGLLCDGAVRSAPL